MKTQKGIFYPSNPDKYLDLNGKPVFRSSWERKFMIWLDNNPSVVEWSSESTIIPYISPVDNKYHRYFIDFSVRLKDNSGNEKDYLVEVKPESQAKEPVKGKKRERTFLNEVLTYGVNQAKWEAARIYCEASGKKFIVLSLDKNDGWKVVG